MSNLPLVADLMDKFILQENNVLHELNTGLEQELSDTVRRLYEVGAQLTELSHAFEISEDNLAFVNTMLTDAVQQKEQALAALQDKAHNYIELEREYAAFKARHKTCMRRSRNYYEKLQNRLIQYHCEEECNLKERIAALEEQLLDRDDAETVMDSDEIIDLTADETPYTSP